MQSASLNRESLSNILFDLIVTFTKLSTTLSYIFYRASLIHHFTIYTAHSTLARSA